MNLEKSSTKWRQFCLDINVFMSTIRTYTKHEDFVVCQSRYEVITG